VKSKAIVDASVGWFEARLQSSRNQNPLRFTKNLVLALRTPEVWQKYYSSPGISSCLLSVTTYWPRQTFSLTHNSFLRQEVGHAAQKQSGKHAKKRLGRKMSLFCFPSV